MNTSVVKYVVYETGYTTRLGESDLTEKLCAFASKYSAKPLYIQEWTTFMTFVPEKKIFEAGLSGYAEEVAMAIFNSQQIHPLYQRGTIVFEFEDHTKIMDMAFDFDLDFCNLCKIISVKQHSVVGWHDYLYFTFDSESG